MPKALQGVETHHAVAQCWSPLWWCNTDELPQSYTGVSKTIQPKFLWLPVLRSHQLTIPTPPKPMVCLPKHYRKSRVQQEQVCDLKATYTLNSSIALQQRLHTDVFLPHCKSLKTTQVVSSSACISFEADSLLSQVRINPERNNGAAPA